MGNGIIQKWPSGRLQVRSVLVGSIVCWGLFTGAGIAQTDESKSEQFSPNPLEITTPDPLAPAGELLTPDQRQTLTTELDKLNAEAQSLLQAGNTLGAFEIWNRELRLRRYLGPVAEAEALSRVGKIAWANDQRLQAQFITERLQAIQQTQGTTSLELLQTLGAAYQQLRAKGPAVETYQQVLKEAQNRQDVVVQAQAMRTIAQIHLNWLNYEKAAIAYEELATFIQEHRAELTAGSGNSPRPVPPSNNNATAPIPSPPTEEESLKQLAYIYTYSRKPLQAIATKERLTALYLNQQNLAAIPPLKVAIASDYEALGQLNLASQYYQEAYTAATAIQQFSVASEALDKLATLYRSQKQLEAALKIYQVQLTIERQSYNLYGVMNAYDKIGQIHMEMKAYNQALDAYQKALEVARQLNHRQDYFAQKIQKVNRQLGRGS